MISQLNYLLTTDDTPSLFKAKLKALHSVIVHGEDE